MTTEFTTMTTRQGDIFWDLAPWMIYTPDFDIGCSIYVANPTDEVKEYALIASLSSEGTLVSETAIPVYGHAWFAVDPGDFIRLRGSFRFDETGCDLTVHLIERETEQSVDSVTTRLMSATSTSSYPPWPDTGSSTGTSTDWSMMMAMILPVMMIGMIGAAATPKEEKKEAVPEKEKVKLLPPGREEL